MVAEHTELPGKSHADGAVDSARLSAADCALFVARARTFRCAAGETFIRAGEPGEQLYLIVEGRVTVERVVPAGQPRMTEERGSGELCGVLAFFSGSAGETEVRPAIDSRLAAMSRDEFHALFEAQPGLWRRLQEIGLARMRRVQLSEHLERLFGPFGAVLPFVIRDLESETRWLSLRSGEVLVRQGESCDGAYLLMAGRTS